MLVGVVNMKAKLQNGNAVGTVPVDAKPELDQKHVSAIMADVERDIGNGNIVNAGATARDLIDGLNSRAQELNGAGYLPAAREQALQGVKITYMTARYEVNKAIENLISEYYGFGSAVDELDVNSIFDLVHEISATESTPGASAYLITEFLGMLKANSKRAAAAENPDHLYSAEQADMASLTAMKAGDTVVPSEVTEQALYAIEQYNEALSQVMLDEVRQEDQKDHDELIKYCIARISDLAYLARDANKEQRALLRRLQESAKALAPLPTLHERKEMPER